MYMLIAHIPLFCHWQTDTSHIYMNIVLVLGLAQTREVSSLCIFKNETISAYENFVNLKTYHELVIFLIP